MLARLFRRSLLFSLLVVATQAQTSTSTTHQMTPPEKLQAEINARNARDSARLRQLGVEGVGPLTPEQLQAVHAELAKESSELHAYGWTHSTYQTLSMIHPTTGTLHFYNIVPKPGDLQIKGLETLTGGGFHQPGVYVQAFLLTHDSSGAWKAIPLGIRMPATGNETALTINAPPPAPFSVVLWHWGLLAVLIFGGIRFILYALSKRGIQQDLWLTRKVKCPRCSTVHIFGGTACENCGSLHTEVRKSPDDKRPITTHCRVCKANGWADSECKQCGTDLIGLALAASAPRMDWVNWKK